MSNIGNTLEAGIKELRPRLAEHVKAKGITPSAELEQELVDFLWEREGGLIEALDISEKQLRGIASAWIEDTMEDLKLEQTGEKYVA